MITIRPAMADVDAKLIFMFLAATMYPELANGVELDPGKALWEIYQVCANGAAYLVEEDDVTIASMGLIKVPYWFSKQEFLTELWFYVRPDKRDGPAFKMLIKEARTMADMTDMEVKLHYGTAKTRAIHTPLEREAVEFEFWPKRELLNLTPRSKVEGHG
jgi:hypothetical protein